MIIQPALPKPTTPEFTSLRQKMAEEQSEMWTAFLHTMVDGQHNYIDLFGGLRFGDQDVLESPQALMRYLNYRMRSLAQSGSATEESISHLRHLINNTNSAMNLSNGRAAKYGLPTPEGTTNAPPFPHWMIPETTRAAIAKSDSLERQLGDWMSGTEAWKKKLLSSFSAPLMKPVTEEDALKLAGLENQLVGLKASVKDIALHGTNVGMDEDMMEGYEGAYNMVGRYMIDYDKVSNVDNIFKLFWPFWMFPSRSTPFWLRQMVDHPEMILFYNKYIMTVNRYQQDQRLLNSKGQPMRSMRGYVKIPGTGMWINPIAPLSFRFAFEFVDTLLDPNKYANDEFDMKESPWVKIVSYIADVSRSTGMDLPPWMVPLMAGITGEDRNQMFLSSIPVVNLLPKFWYTHLLQKMFMTTREASYTKYDEQRYEIELYGMVLDKLKTTNSEAEKQILINEMLQVLGYEQDYLNEPNRKRPREDSPMWREAVRRADLRAAGTSNAGYFLGVYPKQYTTGSTVLWELQRAKNAIRDQINNEVLAWNYGSDPSPVVRYREYLDWLNRDDAFINQLFFGKFQRFILDIF
jgi:hypothetical protein